MATLLCVHQFSTKTPEGTDLETRQTLEHFGQADEEEVLHSGCEMCSLPVANHQFSRISFQSAGARLHGNSSGSDLGNECRLHA